MIFSFAVMAVAPIILLLAKGEWHQMFLTPFAIVMLMKYRKAKKERSKAQKYFIQPKK